MGGGPKTTSVQESLKRYEGDKQNTSTYPNRPGVCVTADHMEARWSNSVGNLVACFLQQARAQGTVPPPHSPAGNHHTVPFSAC